MEETISSADRELILADQVKDLYANSFTANLTLLVISPLLAWILWPVATQVPILLWYFYSLGIVLFRVMFVAFYNHSGGASRSSLFWLKGYVCGVVLSGLGWGAVLILVAPLESFFYVVSTVFIICGLVTGSAASLASLKYGYAAFSIPALLPGAIYLVFLGRSDSVLIGISIFTFLLFLSFVALRIHKTILYGIRQQFKYSRLIVELELEKQEMENKNRALEKQLNLLNRKTLKFRTLLKNKIESENSDARIANLHARDDRLRLLLDKLNGGIWDCNLKTGEVKYSPAWLEMLGYGNDDVQLTMDFWKSLLHPDERQDVLDRLYMHTNGHSPVYSSSHRLKSKSGSWVWVMSRGQSVAWGTYGEVLNLSSIEIIISDSNDDLSSKLNMINFDINDWFYSTEQFNEHLQHVLQTVAIEGVEHMLCHLKIFKQNTTAADISEAEDTLLNQVGRILLKESRHGDAIVNYGKNGFGLLIEYCSINSAWAKAKALQDIFKSYQFIRGNSSMIGVCIGITPILDVYKSVEDILKDAEMACDIARIKAPNHIYLYQKGNIELSREFAEKQVLHQIQEAITNKCFQLSTLPLRPASRNALGNESIFFMDTGLASNDETFHAIDFRSVADNNNLSSKVDQCSVELFYTWVHAQPKSYVDEKLVYILECSLSSMSDPDFVTFLQNISKNRAPTKHMICFGISENMLVSNNPAVTGFINAVKPLGYRFALNRFGSTPFSYDYLMNQPFDYLIIDSALIDKVETDKASFLTVKYISEISHVMNLKTIAGNVNSAHLLETLKGIEIDYAHGNVFAQPKSIII